VALLNAPSTLGINQSVGLKAAVTDDSGNGGVDWTCSPAGACGSFNPSHTANGATTTYTAPGAAGTVGIVAAASDQGGSSAGAMISVVSDGMNSELSGNYVFFVEGTDASGTYVAAGTIVLDGNGNITNGEQDYVDQGGVQVGPDPATGIYSIGPGNRGSITLIVNDARLPSGGIETFSIAATSASHALIIEFDGSATSSGTLDLQSADATNASTVGGSYSFALNGYDMDNSVPAAFGGVTNMSAAAGIVSSGAFYANDGGTTQMSPQFNGPVTGPDTFGRGTIRTSVGLNFVYYAVQGEVLRIVETDLPDFISGGSFYGQGSTGANSAFSDASLSGTAAFFESGSSVNGPLSIAGQFTADGSGNLTAGIADTNSGGSYASGSIAGQGVYSITGTGAGTLTFPGTPSTTEQVSSLLIFATDPDLNLLDPNNAAGGGGALILDYDNNAIGTGMIVSQSSGTFQGNYAIALQFYNSAGQEDFAGQLAANGSGSVSGSVDLNDKFVPMGDVSLSGTFTPDSMNAGRYTGGLTVGGETFQITYYQASDGALLMVDTDSSDVGSGAIESQ